MINLRILAPHEGENKLINNIFKLLIELFIFDKYKRSIIKARWAKRHLEKYLDIPQGQFSSGTPSDDPSENITIWSYWHQGKENAPELIQKCFQSVEKFEGKSGNNRKIHILSFDTIKDYVELPQIYYDLVNSGKMPIALFSDILRLYLLTRYGGVWIDSTIMLTDKIPRDIIDSSFCVARKNPEKDYQENKMSCYFIRADKNSPNLNAIKGSLENYWAKNNFVINYFMFEHISTMLSDKTPELKAEWDKMPYIDSESCGKLQIFMDKNLTQDEFEKLKSETFMHKLTYKKQMSKEFCDTIFV